MTSITANNATDQERGCALITGGTRGIGRACALALAHEGLNLVINHSSASSAQAAEEVAQEARSAGVEALVACCNVADFDAVKDMVKQATEAFGFVEVLVNNAGINADGLLMRMKEEDFDAVIDVNLKGSFNTIRHCIGGMAKHRSGRIIQITSVAGIMGNPGQTNYAASKAGVIGMVKTVAREYAARGITCNAIAPGFIATDMTANMKQEVLEEMLTMVPLGRMGQPEDIASMCAFLASDKASYITGQVFQVDGGMAI